MIRVAKTISIIFHPVLMPLAGIYILLNSGIFEINIPIGYKTYIYIFVGVFSFLLPISFLLLLYYWKLVSSIQLSEQRERFLPMIFVASSLVLLNIVLGRIVPINLLNAYTFTIAAVSVLLLIANFIIKISLHLTALGGLSGLVLILSFAYNANLFVWFVMVVIISGIVGSARLYDNCHSSHEVFFGYLLGLISTFGLMFLFIN